jgi:hypothetical protein
LTSHSCSSSCPQTPGCRRPCGPTPVRIGPTVTIPAGCRRDPACSPFARGRLFPGTHGAGDHCPSKHSPVPQPSPAPASPRSLHCPGSGSSRRLWRSFPFPHRGRPRKGFRPCSRLRSRPTLPSRLRSR